MLCILAPEMALGKPRVESQKRAFFDSLKLDGTRFKKSKPELAQTARDVKSRTLGSMLSVLSYDSVKTSVTRAASVRVTKREKKTVRAQDIFTDPNP